ncbi:MAG: DNA-binding protein [Gammaproteobacteria bacterium]|nr:DNA-binding protein [Gammaproteobacteria bacterium]
MSNHRSIALLFLFVSFNLLSTSVSADTGTVISTMDASGYTYVEANMGDKNIWLAGPNTKLAKGDSITVKLGEPMHNFHSKSLKRDFSAIYFVSGFSGSTSSEATLPTGHAPINGSKAITATKKITLNKPVKRAMGGKTIAEIIAGKKELSGKKIKVRGQVTKFSPEIMAKNWIHLIDGSTESDLIITTNDKTKVGQVVTIEGTVVLDKDFGYGYFYKLLIEDARVTVK